MLLFGLAPNEQFLRANISQWKQLLGIEGENKEVYKSQFLSLFTLNKHVLALMSFVMTKVKEKG